MSDAVVVLSGGMDSTVLAHHVRKELNLEITCLSFNYGQRHEKELQMAEWQANELDAPHKIIQLDLGYNSSALTNVLKNVPTMEDVLGHPQPPTYVPNRNMILLSIAAGVAEDLDARGVYYGAHRSDQYGYWDTTSDFLEAINFVIGLNRLNQIEIVAPFVEYTKTHILEMGLKLNVDFSKTWTCYVGEEKACGKCPTCAERLKTFRDLGRVDPLSYQS